MRVHMWYYICSTKLNNKLNLHWQINWHVCEMPIVSQLIMHTVETLTDYLHNLGALLLADWSV